MNLPTDEQLKLIAQREALKFPVREPMANASYRVGLRDGVGETLFHDLKIDRISYRLLMQAEQFYKDCMEFDKATVFTSHLTTLRTRLGITE